MPQYPQWSFEPAHPCAPTPEEAYALLATAILVGLVADLESPSPKRRQEAREAVAAGCTTSG